MTPMSVILLRTQGDDRRMVLGTQRPSALRLAVLSRLRGPFAFARNSYSLRASTLRAAFHR